MIGTIEAQTGNLIGRLSTEEVLVGRLTTTLPDGDFESGYTEGYAKGHTDGVEVGYSDGKAEGYSEGLAARTYETWEITLADGAVIEKDVALL